MLGGIIQVTLLKSISLTECSVAAAELSVGLVVYGKVIVIFTFVTCMER